MFGALLSRLFQTTHVVFPHRVKDLSDKQTHEQIVKSSIVMSSSLFFLPASNATPSTYGCYAPLITAPTTNRTNRTNRTDDVGSRGSIPNKIDPNSDDDGFAGENT